MEKAFEKANNSDNFPPGPSGPSIVKANGKATISDKPPWPKNDLPPGPKGPNTVKAYEKATISAPFPPLARAGPA